MLAIVTDPLARGPKGEVACLDARLQQDPHAVLDALLRRYGERRTPDEILRDFMLQQQRPGESAADYAGVLALSFQALQQRQRACGAPVSPATMLRDHFAASVADQHLRRLLKERVLERPRSTLTEVKDFATRWENPSAVFQEAEAFYSNRVYTAPAPPSHPSATPAPAPVSAPVAPTPQTGASLQEVVNALAGVTSSLKDLTVEMGEQRRQLADHGARLDRIERGRGSRTPLECWSCRQLGHIASRCPKKEGSHQQQQQGNGQPR